MKPLPHLPDLAPRRRSLMARRCWHLLLQLLGWEIEGELPNLPRFVLIGAPHTSNWDFVIAMSAIGALGLRLMWLGKHTLFRWPFGPVLRRLGGIPVDRRSAHGTVACATAVLNASARLVIGMAPEGTRARTERWKSGFYHIATGAGVPIVPAYLDFRRRRIGTGAALVPSGNMDADIRTLRAFYAPYAQVARRPEQYASGEDA